MGVLLVGGLAVLAVVIVVILVVVNQKPAVEVGEYTEVPAEWRNRNVLGDPAAPVTLQAWEDFLCPACAAFNRQVKPQLYQDYITAGTVKLEYHYFPLSIHEPGASLAAQGAECAADQGAFWPYHDRLFQANSQGQSGFTGERLIDYADELGLDRGDFTRCLTGQQHLAEVRDSLSGALELGLDSTPSLLVNGTKVENPMDYTSITAVIEQQVSASGN